ncbi:MAG: acetate kinase [bacterium]|nr:acetate kinase [bacterium]
MKILVLNCGSSSIKYQLFDTDKGEQPLAKGLVERIGMRDAILNHHRIDGDKVKLVSEIIDHQVAIEYILAILMSSNHGVIKDRNEIDAVGHRVVHGGEKFTGSVMIDDEVMAQLHECIELAPLHNPANIKGIKACKQLMPTIPQVGVFDTAFHHTIPDYAYMYALPYVLYKRYSIRRFGFHGTSHYYVAHRAAAMLKRPITELKLITIHLGNGCSMAAVNYGKSVDTSMGFTPVEGLVMGARCGDIDPAALLHIMEKEDLSRAEANALMNKHSGLIGLSGTSSDMRDILNEIRNGNERANLALNVFCYRIRKYLGAYWTVLGSLDAVVFTGGIGENAAEVRKRVLQNLEQMGIVLNYVANENLPNTERDISDESSKVRVLVIPTNEELVIARDTEKLVRELQKG